MKKVLIVLGIVAVLAVVFFVIPMKVVVEETTIIKASKAVVYENVSKFSNFQKWSPWSKLDPSQKSEITGGEAVVGSKYSWSSESDEVGTGSQTVTAISQDRIDMDLEFTAPWQSQAKVYFLLGGEDNAATVTWGYEGEGNMMMKMMVSNMLSKSYKDGFSELKKLCEE